MKRHIIYILAILGLIVPAADCQAAGIIEQADSAYTADDFATAARLYTEAIDSIGSSATLYYNLGNAYYRMGNLGKAIVNYERSLRLDPTNQDARENLAFVNARITDQIGDSGTFLSNTVDNIVASAHPDTWGLIALSSFILMLGAIALYVFASNVAIRKTGFFGGLILLAVTIIANILAFRGAGKAQSHTTAIVIEPSTILSTSPRQPKDRSEEAFLLHEGTKVEILDSVAVPADTTGRKWYDVSVDNSHRAWISSDAIEKI
ncbi:MAG: tetratricopeptide repeat protein [Muribaculaceae bacterium]|nr:tetratricopeptide repeat protein [Muribaculaceae bacterium]